MVDALAVHQRLLAAFQHALQRRGTLRDRLGVAGEQIEKNVPPWEEKRETNAALDNPPFAERPPRRPFIKLSYTELAGKSLPPQGRNAVIPAL